MRRSLTLPCPCNALDELVGKPLSEESLYQAVPKGGLGTCISCPSTRFSLCARIEYEGRYKVADTQRKEQRCESIIFRRNEGKSERAGFGNEESDKVVDPCMSLVGILGIGKDCSHDGRACLRAR